MPEGKDPLDREKAIERLQAALPLQYRSAVAYTLAAAVMTGVEYVAISDELWRFGAEDLADARRLSEKLVTLHGAASADVESLGFDDGDPESVLSKLIELEGEAIERLQDVIPATGHTGESEALEHRLEHMIMRKQEQVDTLARALRRKQ